jgi:hypothetical protein
MKICTCLKVAAIFILFPLANLQFAATSWVPLAGPWQFALDPKNEGISQKWFRQRLKDQIHLPGTTDDNRKGPLNQARETEHLTRLYPYVGAAWYQREIVVPAAWTHQRVVLLLERTKSSRLWLDDNPLGEQDSLVAPHQYVLPKLSAGTHQLTLRIHNGEHAPIGDPHQISDHTQTNWNGVIGRVGLEVVAPTWIEEVQVYPNRASRKVKIRVELGNSTGQPFSGTLTLTGNAGKRAFLPILRLPIQILAGAEFTRVDTEIPLGERVAEWDEFSPVLYQLQVSWQATSSSTGFQDQKEIAFGLRDFEAVGRKFQVNGRTTFLRGKHDACIFPLTGYPPMTVEGWLRVFQIAKNYGINHYRFHTWCPPEAAFVAADRLGIYLQPELPNWQAFGEKTHDDFLRAEGERILRTFGNHPSFVMLSLGNELGGKQELMAPFISHFRSLDPRHLYAQGTNNWFPGPGSGDDYYASFQVHGKKIRGSFGTVDAPLGHIQTGPPSTSKDYSLEIAPLSIPVVSHEIGEYQSAPDFREIKKYTGILAPWNLEAFRQRLASSGLLGQAHDFLQASGTLSVLCYREEIEAALRTRDFAGLQLLDLQDFPGQGTALVGILNSFMESKGFIEPTRWREFCSETVPLVRMEKYTWKNTETYIAQAEAAHYGKENLPKTTPAWTLSDAAGKILASGPLAGVEVPQGSLTGLGEIRIPLRQVPAPAKLKLELKLEGTAFKNSYPVWVYPDSVNTDPGKVLIRRSLDENTYKTLFAGQSVLLLPELPQLTRSIQGSFAPDFWNYGMFKRIAEERKMPVAPGTLGIWCDPKNPAFSRFPTDFHSNWQWFHLLMNSRAMILDASPAGLMPIVQVIDNYERVHRLGVIFEALIGKGKLLVCSIDLLGQIDRPEARQLLHSLLHYMNSSQFSPRIFMEQATLQSIVR